MYTLNLPAIAYYDNQTFQVKYPVYVDDELYARIGETSGATPTVLQEWSDLVLLPAQAIQKVNNYLNARYMGTHTEWYVYNPLNSTQPQWNITHQTSLLNSFGVNVTQIRPTTGDDTRTEVTPTNVSLLNGTDLTNTQRDNMARTAAYKGTPIGTIWAGGYNYISSGGIGQAQSSMQFQFQIAPSDYFVDNALNPAYALAPGYCLYVAFTFNTNADLVVQRVTKITISALKYFPNVMVNAFNGLDLTRAMPDIDDYSNPYSSDGTAGPGGGDGTLPGSGLDSVDPAEIPDLPAISAADLGFITMYNPTSAQLKLLSDYMWSNAFDLVTYKKLFSDPMQSIIGLSIVPVAPTIGGSKNVHFGTIDSGISMSYLSTNYVQLDCGSVAVEKYIGCFMDNDPYTKISIYLPFIGIRQLSADDIIGGSIHVVYNIDVLTGACACFIEHSTRGVLYSYNGSCITNVPLTAVNFSGAIQNAVSAIGSAVGMAAGMATGAAPLTAMSAIGLMTSAANTALNSKPSVQRSGNLGGSAGILSIMNPYVIIERPALSVPNKVQHYAGQTSNITMNLVDCKGFTMCEFVHLDGISATTDEIMEIESLLKVGVIL